MTKKRLKLRGTLLIVAALVSGMVGFSLVNAGEALIFCWAGIAGFCLLMCLGLAAFLEAYQQKKQ